MLRYFIAMISVVIVVGCAAPKDAAVISQAQSTNSQLSPAVLNDKQLNAYFQQIGNRIVASAKKLDAQNFGPASHKQKDQDDSWMYSDVQFHCVNSKTLNAFTTGGHHVYIYNELFQDCKNEDELAAVMSHEYAHIYCRHVAKGMQRGELLAGASAVGAVGGYVAGGKDNGQQYAGIGASLVGAGAQYYGMSYTREDENEADKIGFWFYSHAGWDPQKFDGFFKTMIAKGLDTAPESMSDHPKLANRVTNTEARIKQLPADAQSWRKPDIASAAKFKSIQQLAAKLAKTNPDDKSLAAAQLMFSAFPSCVSPTEQPDQKQAQSVLGQILQKQPQQQH